MRGLCHECSRRPGKDVPLTGEMAQLYHKKVRSFRRQSLDDRPSGPAFGIRIANAGTYVK